MEIYFDMSEIIAIVMEIINELEHKNMGIEDYDFYLPEPLRDKIDNLEMNKREKLLDICDDIGQEVIEFKSGELNSINVIHNEIIYIAKENLTEFLR